MGTELTNMVMIYDRKNDAVLVQRRIRSWKGISFPGGHVEDGESFVASAIREIKEETGLDIANLKSCGVFHWCNDRTFERYVVFLYKTEDYGGTLIPETEEGEVFWVKREVLPSLKLSPNFERHLPMFFEGRYSEAFGRWNDDTEYDIEYR